VRDGAVGVVGELPEPPNLKPIATSR